MTTLIPIKSGVIALVSSVRSYFASHGVTAAVSIGWRQPTEQINQGPGRANRVVFIPSDPNGRGGKIAGPHQPGPRTFATTNTDKITTRALCTWERLLTVSVWAADTSAPQDESLQIEAVESLFEWVVRAVHAAAPVNAQWGDVGWTTKPTELLFGRELRANLTYRHPLFDTETGVAFPTGHITKTLEG